MSYFVSMNRWISRRIGPAFQRRPSVSTYKRNDTVVDADTCQKQVSKKVVLKNWMSYGFVTDNKTDDRFITHTMLFVGLTLCGVIGGGFIWVYAPDYHLRDWSVREGFLELRRREAAGKLPIDPNFLPPENIILPSDEELENTEIII